MTNSKYKYKKEILGLSLWISFEKNWGKKIFKRIMSPLICRIITIWKGKRIFIEDCFCLIPKELKLKPIFLKLGNWYETKFLTVNIKFISDVKIEVSFKNSWREISQTLNLVKVPITFGMKAYFICPSCKEQCYFLYLPPRKNSFICRNCLTSRGIYYELSYMNERSIRGNIAYAEARIRDIKRKATVIRSKTYNGKVTKRVEALITHIDKWRNWKPPS